MTGITPLPPVGHGGFTNAAAPIRPPGSPGVSNGWADRVGSQSFGDALIGALSRANELELASDRATTQLATGKSDDIIGAVVAAEKAQLAVGTVLRLRQQALESYEQIMRMPL